MPAGRLPVVGAVELPPAELPPKPPPLELPWTLAWLPVVAVLVYHDGLGCGEKLCILLTATWQHSADGGYGRCEHVAAL